MRLEKYHGSGNDFLVLVDLDGRHGLDAAAARALCHRRRGVGADGIIRVTGGADGYDVAMELFNADGGRAEMSGNGIRCVARAVVDAGLVGSPRLTVKTDAGHRTVTVQPDGRVSVDMGRAEVGPDQLQAISGWEAHTVDLGNPHLVLVGPDPATVHVTELGPKLEAMYPDGINVEFVSVGPGPDSLTMRVWERGVGETESCGSGACAAAAAAASRGLVGGRVTVHQPGGDAEVELGDSIVLTGPAEHVCTVELACP